MTKEQIERASKFETAFRYAMHSNFFSLNSGEFGEIAALYQEMFKTSLTRSQQNCSSCRLNAMKRIGEQYFEWKERFEKADQTRLNNKNKDTK